MDKERVWHPAHKMAMYLVKTRPLIYGGPMAGFYAQDIFVPLKDIPDFIRILQGAREVINRDLQKAQQLAKDWQETDSPSERIRRFELGQRIETHTESLKSIDEAIKVLQDQLAEYPECAWCAGRGKKGTNRCPQCNELFPAQSALVAKLNEAMKARFGEENCLLCRKESDDVQFVVDALRAAGIEPDIFLQVAHDEFYTDFRLDLEIDSFGCLMSLSDFIFIAVKTFK